MQRVEFVAKAPDAEGRRPIGGEKAGIRHPGLARELDGGRKLHDEVGMQPAHRDRQALSDHRIARGRGSDQIGLGFLDRRSRRDLLGRALLQHRRQVGGGRIDRRLRTRGFAEIRQLERDLLGLHHCGGLRPRQNGERERQRRRAPNLFFQVGELVAQRFDLDHLLAQVAHLDFQGSECLGFLVSLFLESDPAVIGVLIMG